MYKYHTPSGDKTCDGLAMALRAGLALRDMEMVQFHPTGLLAGAGTRMTGTVLEEGLRGAGGCLLDSSGARFMFDYDERGERATRDVVSRSIMYQSATALRRRTAACISRWPSRARRCAQNCSRAWSSAAPIAASISPAAGRGGADRALHDGRRGVRPRCRTSMPRLFAAGEDTGGVHGANRLGGNGVANSTVFGGIAGAAMARAVLREAEPRRTRSAGDRRGARPRVLAARPCARRSQ